MARIFFSLASVLCVLAAADEACNGECEAMLGDVSFLQTASNLSLVDAAAPTEEEAEEVTSAVSLNASGDLVKLIKAIIITSIIVLIFMAVTSILRSLYPMILNNNSLNGRVKDLPPYDWTSWVWASLSKDRAEHIEVCGLDQAMILEFLVFCMRLSMWIGVPALFITGPLNVFTGHGEAERVGDTLSLLGINNVRPGHPFMYKVYGVLTVYIAFITHWEISRTMLKFCGYRSSWLKSLSNPRASTIRVEGIPEDYQSEEKVREFFSRMFSPDVVKEVSIVKHIPQLEEVHASWTNAKFQLDKVERQWAKDGKKEDARPKVSLSMIAGSEMDAIEYWTEQVEQTEAQVKTYQQQIEVESKSGVGGVNGHTAYVTFAGRKEARVAESVPFTAQKNEWVIGMPSEPSDIIWADLKVPDEKKATKRFIGYGLVAGVYFVFTPFCVGVTNIAESIDLGYFQPMWSSFAPTLGLLIFLSFVPTVLLLIFGFMFHYKTNAVNQEQLQIYYFYFQFFFVVLVTVVGADFSEFLADLISDPLYFPFVLADKMPSATHYYLNFLVAQWMTQGMGLTRYMQVTKFVGFRKIWDDEPARQMAEPEDQDYYGIGSRMSRFTAALSIVIIFGLISPLMGFLGWALFFICRIFYGYLLVYAETRKDDNGGCVLVTAFHHTYFSLMTLITLMIGIFGARAPTAIPITLATASWFYVIWAWNRFSTIYEWETLPWADMLLEKDGTKRIREDTGEHYTQPQLLPIEQSSSTLSSQSNATKVAGLMTQASKTGKSIIS